MHLKISEGWEECFSLGKKEKSSYEKGCEEEELPWKFGFKHSLILVQVNFSTYESWRYEI